MAWQHILYKHVFMITGRLKFRNVNALNINSTVDKRASQCCSLVAEFHYGDVQFESQPRRRLYRPMFSVVFPSISEGRKSTSNRPQPVCSKSFPIRHSPVFLSPMLQSSFFSDTLSRFPYYAKAFVSRPHELEIMTGIKKHKSA
jgi:hypothetical protein